MAEGRVAERRRETERKLLMLLAFVIKCLGTSSPVALLLLSTNDDEREYKSEAGI